MDFENILTQICSEISIKRKKTKCKTLGYVGNDAINKFWGFLITPTNCCSTFPIRNEPISAFCAVLCCFCRIILVVALLRPATAQNYLMESISQTSNMDGPVAITRDTAGNLFIAEVFTCNVKLLTPSLELSNYAGSGSCSFTGDGGAATSATLYSPYGLFVNTQGDLYISEYDMFVSRIRLVNGTTGVISTMAGGGSSGDSGDGGPATSASITGAFGIAGDTQGNVYIASQNGNVIRRVNSTGIISTFAGTGTAALNTTTGPATATSLLAPTGVWVNSNGDLFISDQVSIRQVDVATSTMSTLRSSDLNYPYALTGDLSGNLLIANTLNFYVQRLNIFSRSFQTIAGMGKKGVYTDGVAATSSSIGSAYGITMDPQSMSIYVTDSYSSIVHNLTVSHIPTAAPTSRRPTVSPPTSQPTGQPSSWPSSHPTAAPTARPSTPAPSVAPTSAFPSYSPTTAKPSRTPLPTATRAPTATAVPSAAPSTRSPIYFGQPTEQPVTALPTAHPTASPSEHPTVSPIGAPTEGPAESAQPSSQPSAAPTALNLSAIYQCTDRCATGFYLEAVDRSCNICLECSYPYTTLTDSDESECRSLDVNAAATALVVVFTMLIALFAGGVYLAGDEVQARLKAFGLLFLPAMDVLTDLAYLLTIPFYDASFFWASVAFLLLPSTLLLSYKLMQLRALPALPAPISFLWLGMTSSGCPLINNRELEMFRQCTAQFFVCVVIWPVLVLAQLLTLPLAVLYFAVMTLLLLIWLLVGLVLLQMKVFAVRSVWNLWFRVWTGGEELLDISEDVDGATLNASILCSAALESCPQAFIQLVNCYLIAQWSGLAIASIAFSGVMVLHGIYLLCYWILYEGKSLCDIPIRRNISTSILSFEAIKLTLRSSASDSDIPSTAISTPVKPVAMKLRLPVLERRNSPLTVPSKSSPDARDETRTPDPNEVVGLLGGNRRNDASVGHHIIAEGIQFTDTPFTHADTQFAIPRASIQPVAPRASRKFSLAWFNMNKVT